MKCGKVEVWKGSSVQFIDVQCESMQFGNVQCCVKCLLINSIDKNIFTSVGDAYII